MPTIEELLDPEVRERVALAPKAEERSCSCLRTDDGFRNRGDGTAVHAGCGLQVTPMSTMKGRTPGEQVTTPCAGKCGQMVRVRVRTVAAEFAELPRLAVCRECADHMLQGKSGTVLKPKAKPETPTPKESNLQIDLDTMNDAEIGAALRKSAKKKAADALPEKRKKAKGKAKKKDKKKAEEHKAARNDLASIGVLDGFTVKSVEVPPLDVSALENLDEAVPAKVRSPYNKIRYRLGKPLLPSGKEPTEDCTTWQMLIDFHQELAANPGAPVGTPLTKKKGKKVQVAAPVALDEAAKVAVLVEKFGVSEKKARKMLAEVGAL